MMRSPPRERFAQSERTWRRWQLERQTRIVHEDLRDLERVQETSRIELLMEALPVRVGSPLSLRSLQENLQVSHDSVGRWLEILERLYFCFRLAPYGTPRIRAVKKEQKLYLWDWSLVENPGARFENLVASHLLKFCHHQQDTEGHRMELRYIRDTDKREVDFVVIKDRKPLFAVEAKLGEAQLSPHLRYFAERTPIPLLFQTHLGTAHFGDASRGGEVIPFERLCEKLHLN